MKTYIYLLITSVFLLFSCQSESVKNSAAYLGQTPPGTTPEIFAPGIISLSEEYEFGSVFSKDAKAFFWGVELGNRTEIRYSQLIEGQWTKARTVVKDSVYGFNDPFLSPEEDRLFYISNYNPEEPDEPKDYDIWYSKKIGEEWSAPINAGPNINSERNEYYISFTSDGSMYFASNKMAEPNRLHDFDIYKAPKKGNSFGEAQVLSDQVNHEGYEADVFVAPDESYLIFCSTRREGLGNGDLYISFKNDEDQWTKAQNMGAPINTVEHELCPFVSADGRFLFYTSNQDIYWVDAKIIDQMRPKE